RFQPRTNPPPATRSPAPHLLFREGPVRMHDLPVPIDRSIDLGAVPAHGAFAAMAHELERQDRGLTDYLHARIDDFVAIDFDLAADLAVPFRQSGDPIQTPIDKWIEVRYVGRVDFEIAVRITLAPTIERRALQL